MLSSPNDKDKLELKTLPGAKPGTGGLPQPGPADTASGAKPVPVKPSAPVPAPAAPGVASKS